MHKLMQRFVCIHKIKSLLFSTTFCFPEIWVAIIIFFMTNGFWGFEEVVTLVAWFQWVSLKRRQIGRKQENKNAKDPLTHRLSLTPSKSKQKKRFKGFFRFLRASDLGTFFWRYLRNIHLFFKWKWPNLIFLVVS